MLTLDAGRTPQCCSPQQALSRVRHRRCCGVAVSRPTSAALLGVSEARNIYLQRQAHTPRARLSGPTLLTSRRLACSRRGAVRRGSASVVRAALLPRLAGFNPLGFEAHNELFVGRCAMLGLVAALMGERLTGKGPLAQLNMETGVSVTQLEPLFILFVVALATTAFVPFSDYLVGETSPAAPALGIRYTDSRQRLLGRLSMAAFATALVLEAVTGSGPLDLLELDTGVPMDEIEAGFVFLLLLVGTGDVGEVEEESTATQLGVAMARGESFADDEADFDWNADDGEPEDD